MRAAALIVIAACGGSKQASPPIAVAPQPVNQAPLPPPPPERPPVAATPAPPPTPVPPGPDESPAWQQPGPTGPGIGIGAAGARRKPVKEPPGTSTGRPTVNGALSLDVVRRVMRRHVSEIRYCYEKHLLADPQAGGLLVAKIVVATDGTVKNVTATGIHADVEACVVARIKSWSFPTFTGDVVVISYPFTLQPT